MMYQSVHSEMIVFNQSQSFFYQKKLHINMSAFIYIYYVIQWIFKLIK